MDWKVKVIYKRNSNRILKDYHLNSFLETRLFNTWTEKNYDEFLEFVEHIGEIDELES